jgi:GNAT superfamily N-acetyltransferase
MSAEFQLDDISFRVDGPQPGEDWPDVVELRHEAYAAALPDRSEEDISYLSQREDVVGFFASCLNPRDAANAGRSYAEQAFANPVVAKAYDSNGEVVGFGYAADNVSGRFASERWLKMRSTSMRYAWLREIVVHPDVQHQGIGTALGALMLDNFDERQPVSAYTWEENPAGIRFAQSVGLTPARNEQGLVPRTVVRPFGPGARAAQQARWEASSVGQVQDYISIKPGAEAALAQARQPRGTY